MEFLRNLFGKKQKANTPSTSVPTKSTSPAKSYYGLSVGAGNVVKYSGPLNKMDLEGSDVPDFIQQLLQQTPSAHLLTLPQMGLVIAIRSSNDFLAFQFRSPMSKDDATNFLSSVLNNRKIKMVEQYGAIEML